MKNIYLALAIVGGIIPYLFFLDFIQLEGFNIPLFIESLFVNGAAGGFSADLFLTSIVFWVFMFQQAKRRVSPSPHMFVILNLCVGLSCALPAYLFAREKSS